MLQLDSLVMKDLQVLSKDFMPSPLELTSKQRWISWVPYECLLECPKGQLGHFPIKLTMELLRALSSDDQLWLYCCHTASLFSLSPSLLFFFSDFQSTSFDCHLSSSSICIDFKFPYFSLLTLLVGTSFQKVSVIRYYLKMSLESVYHSLKKNPVSYALYLWTTACFITSTHSFS